MKSGIASDGKRTIAQAMIGIFERENPWPACCALGELQRTLDRLGPAVGRNHRGNAVRAKGARFVQQASDQGRLAVINIADEDDAQRLERIVHYI